MVSKNLFLMASVAICVAGPAFAMDIEEGQFSVSSHATIAGELASYAAEQDIIAYSRVIPTIPSFRATVESATPFRALSDKDIIACSRVSIDWNSGFAFLTNRVSLFREPRSYRIEISELIRWADQASSNRHGYFPLGDRILRVTMMGDYENVRLLEGLTPRSYKEFEYNQFHRHYRAEFCVVPNCEVTDLDSYEYKGEAEEFKDTVNDFIIYQKQ